MPNVYDQFEPGVNPYDQFDTTTKEGLPKDWLTYKPPTPAIPEGRSEFPFGGPAPGQAPSEDDISFTRAFVNRPTIPLEMAAGAVVQATEGAGRYLHKGIVDLSQMIERGTGLPVGLSGDESLYPTAYATEEGMKEKGLLPGAARFLYGLGKPENVALLPFAPTKPVQAYFAAGAVEGIPESMRQVLEAKTPEELREAYLNFGLNTTMAGLIGRHMMKGKGYAPEERVVEQGQIPEYPGAETQRIPAEAGRGDRLQPAAPVEEKTQVPLTPIEASKEKLRILFSKGRAQEANAEIDWLLQHGVSGAEIHEAVYGKKAQSELTAEDAKYLEDERAGISADVAVGPEHLPKGQPFAPREVATINRETGKVVINPTEFSAALKDLPPDQRGPYVRSLLAEEQNHLATTPEDAKAYSEAMTGIEHAMERRAYTGRWTRAGAAEAAGRELSDTDIGFEAIRRRMQQLSRMSPTEVEMTVGRERWKLKTLNVLQRIVSRTMESLPTKGAEARRAALQRVQSNLNVAIAAAGGAAPSSIRRPNDGQEIADKIGARFDGEQMGRWMFTLFDKSGKESTTIVTKAGAEPHEVIGKYNLKRSEYGQQENAPRAPKMGLTELAYERGERMSSEDVASTLAEKSKVEQELMSLYEQGEEAKAHTLSMKSQFLGESAKWRQAIDEARRTGASDVKEMAEIEKKIGVGDNTGKELKAAVTRSWLAEVRPSEEATVEGVKALEPESGRELTATESLVQRLSSIRRPKPPAEHPELFAQKPTYKTAPRKRGLLSGTYEPVTSTAVDQLIQTHLSSEARPSFNEFLSSLKDRFGRVAPEQVRELWQQGVWDYLINAQGSELTSLVKSLGLRREVRVKGEKVQPGRLVSYGREIPDPPAGEERVKRFKQMELGTGNIVEGIEHEAKTAEAQAREDAMRYRYKVISDIGSKLIRESETGRKSWKRTDVEPGEIAFWKESQEPAWNHIGTDDLKDVDALGRVLTTDARQEATGTIRGVKRKTPPVSATKRLTVMQNKQTGKVEMVSTFRDGRRGAVLLDPESPGKTHVPLKSILNRYRPVYSVLIDEPVQNFRKSFKTLSEFEKEFGEEARGHRDEYAARVAELGEGAGVLSEEYGSAPSVLRPSEAITGPEAGSFYDSLKSAVAKLESPDDVRELILQLYGKMERGALLGKDWQTINTLEKAFYALRKKWPELTRSQVRDQTFDELFDIANRAGSREEFAQESIQRYSPEVRETFGRQPPAPVTREPTARELTARERIPPTVDPSVKIPKGEGPTPELPPTQPPEMLSDVEQAFVEQMANERTEYTPTPAPKEEPGSLRRQKQTLEGEFARVADALKAWNERRRTKSDITGWRDSADTVARNLARQAGDMVRIKTMNPSIVYAFKKALLTPGGPEIKSLAFKHYREEQAKTAMVRAAAKAVIAAKGDRGLIDNIFLPSVETGRVKAENLIAHKHPVDKYVGRRWLQAVDRLKAELEYARDHWSDSNLQATAAAVKREMEAEFEVERNHGMKIQHMENYVPGRYEAEIFNDHLISFGEQRILGRNYRKPKQFENYYSAIARGPYIPKAYDVADLVEHRVRQGRMEIEKDGWIDTMSNIFDPVSKQAIVKNPKIVDGKSVVPSNEYELFSFGPNKKTVAIRSGYKNLISMMANAQGLDTSPVGKAALVGTGLLKHGIILILDTFHPGRLMQYMGALMGREISTGRGGWSALDYRKEALPEAIANGYVTEKAAAWAEKPVNLFMDGREQTLTRRQVLEVMQRNGLNVGRLQDAIYKDLVRSWPVIGTLNRWTFDVMTRGLMAESAVRSFEQLNNKYPNEPAMRLMRDVIKDVNAYYGSLGRQGWIRHPAIRDMSQLLFLAPQWVEGLIRKEAGLYGRLAMAPYNIAKGKPVLGTLGTGVAHGLVAYFALTQLMNLMTRRQLTFQNKEEGHKLDAWIPTGEESGFWLSPMSVFAEITHDILRLGESKKTNWEAIRQVGSNKLGPLGRFGLILWTMENPQGQRLTSTGDVMKEAAKQLAPAPISLGTPIRALSHALFPNLVSPPRPGAMQQRLLGAVGIKVQPGESAFQQAQHAATKFMDDAGLKPETGFILVPTDEPSYARLRNAIRNDDPKTAKSVMEHLRKTRTDGDILKAMMLWSKRPLTGSSEGELQWLQEMDDDQFDTYSKALQERQDLWNKFLDFYMQN